MGLKTQTRSRTPDYRVAERLAHKPVLGNYGQGVDVQVHQPKKVAAVVEILADTGGQHFQILTGFIGYQYVGHLGCIYLRMGFTPVKNGGASFRQPCRYERS